MEETEKEKRLQFEIRLRKDVPFNLYAKYMDREIILERVMFGYDNEDFSLYALPSDEGVPHYFTDAFRAAKFALSNKGVRIVVECTFDKHGNKKRMSLTQFNHFGEYRLYYTRQLYINY